MSEVATVVRNLDGIAMSGEMGNAGAMRMSRADSALLARAGEDHLGIGTHERDGDSGTPLELTLDDRPDGISSVLGLLDLLSPERVEDVPEGRPPGAEDGEGGGEKPRSTALQQLGRGARASWTWRRHRASQGSRRPLRAHPLRKPTGRGW